MSRTEVAAYPWSPKSSTLASRIARWLGVYPSVSGRPRGSRSGRQARFADDVVTSEAAVDSAVAEVDTAVSLRRGSGAVKDWSR